MEEQERKEEKNRVFLLRWLTAAGVPIESSSLKSQSVHTHTHTHRHGLLLLLVWRKVLRKEVGAAVEKKSKKKRDYCDQCVCEKVEEMKQVLQ